MLAAAHRTLSSWPRSDRRIGVAQRSAHRERRAVDWRLQPATRRSLELRRRDGSCRQRLGCRGCCAYNGTICVDVTRTANRWSTAKVDRRGRPVDTGLRGRLGAATYPQGTTAPGAPATHRLRRDGIKHFRPIVVPVRLDGLREAFDKTGLKLRKTGRELAVRYGRPLDIDYDQRRVRDPARRDGGHRRGVARTPGFAWPAGLGLHLSRHAKPPRLLQAARPRRARAGPRDSRQAVALHPLLRPEQREDGGEAARPGEAGRHPARQSRGRHRRRQEDRRARRAGADRPRDRLRRHAALDARQQPRQPVVPRRPHARWSAPSATASRW